MVDYEERGHVALLTINRPEARNAVNGEVAKGMEAAIDRLEENPDVWVGVLTGAGPAFCAGADLKAVSSGNGAVMSTERGGFAGLVRRERTKTLIAAVDGPALAGGTEIVLACDLVVASTRARFGIPEVKRSLVAAAGGLFRLPRALPRNVALRMALTGEPISAEDAHRFGLVTDLCEPGAAVETALALADLVNSNAPIAVRESRRVMLASMGEDDEVGWRLSTEGSRIVHATEDFKEGPRAFIEKRDPAWQGR